MTLVPDSHWMAALAAADRGAVKGMAVFTRAVMQARNVALTQPVQDKLAFAATLGDPDAILDCLPWDTLWRVQVEGFEPILLDVLAAGAKSAVPNILQAREDVRRHDQALNKRRREVYRRKWVGNVLMPMRRFTKKEEPSATTTTATKPAGTLNRLKATFTAKSPEAIAWAKLHAGEMISPGADKDAIRPLIVKALDEGIPSRVIAKQIVAYVGLGAQQAATLKNQINAWQKKHPGKAVDPQWTQNKSDALVRKRARFIALNECLVASKQGNQAQLDAAFVSGDLQDGRYLKEWVLTPDDKLCPICSAQRNPDGELLTVAAGDPWPLKAKGITIGMIPHAHPRCRCAQALVENPNWIATPGKEISSLIGGLPKWTLPSVGNQDPIDPDAPMEAIDWLAYTSTANDADLLGLAKAVNERLQGCVDTFVIKEETAYTTGVSASYDAQSKTLTMYRVPGMDWIAQIHTLGVNGYGVKSRLDDVVKAVLTSKRPMETLDAGKDYAYFRAQEQVMRLARKTVLEKLGIKDTQFIGSTKTIEAVLAMVANKTTALKSLWEPKDLEAFKVASTKVAEEAMVRILDTAKSTGALSAKTCEQYKWAIGNAPTGAIGWAHVWATTYSGQEALAHAVAALGKAAASGQKIDPKSPDGKSIAKAMKEASAFVASKVVLPAEVLAQLKAEAKAAPKVPKTPKAPKVEPTVAAPAAVVTPTPAQKPTSMAGGLDPGSAVVGGYPSEKMATKAANTLSAQKGVYHYAVHSAWTNKWLVVKTKPVEIVPAVPHTKSLQLKDGEIAVAAFQPNQIQAASVEAGKLTHLTGQEHYVAQHPVTDNYVVVSKPKGGVAPAVHVPTPTPAVVVSPKPKKVAPEPVTVSPVTPNASDFAAIDSAWIARKVDADKAFTFDRECRSELGGMHSKFIYKDADGNQWLFKPTSEAFRAIGDEVAYKMSRVADPDHVVEVRAVELTVNGTKTLGSIQKLVSDVTIGDFHSVAAASLSKAQLAQINREHVVDWLIGNHDGHAGNLLQTKAGTIVGIDKGQAYKFIAQKDEALSRTYQPNPEESYYQTIAKSLKAGKLDADDFDLSEAFAAIKRAQDLTDIEVRVIVKPYVEGRTQNTAERAKLFDAIVARKNNIASDFEAYWSELLGRPVKVPGTETTDTTVTAKPSQADTPNSVWGWSQKHDLLVEEAVKAGWQGKSIDFDGGIVDDLSALVWQEKATSGMRTVVQMKLRPGVDPVTGKISTDVLDDLVATYGKTPAPAVKKAGQTHAADDTNGYWTALHGMVRTVAAHALDKKFNETSIATAREKITKLVKTLDVDKKTGKLKVKDPSTQDADYVRMAEVYKALLERTEGKLQALTAGKKWGDTEVPDLLKPYYGSDHKFVQYTRKSTEVAPKLQAQTGHPTIKSVTATREDTHRTLDAKGNLVVKSEAETAGKIMNHSLQDEKLWRFELDGVVVKWWGNTETTQALFARRGLLQIEVNGAATPATVQKALSTLKDLGFSEQTVRMSTPADLEVLYLTKTASAAGHLTNNTWLATQASLNGKTTSQQVDILRAYWANALKVKDITKIPGYEPDGYYEAGAVTRQITAGYRQHSRFDVDFAETLKDYCLYSKVTNGTVESLIETVLKGNTSSMLSTTERYRLGLAGNTMSQSADMETGGAAYVFTRMGKTGSVGGQGDLIFKPTLFNRLDRRTYTGDCYGSVNPTKSDSNRRVTAVADVKRVVQNSSNETTFLNSINILDYIKEVHAGSSSARQRIIAIFRSHGHEKLPDGRRIEEVIKE